MAFVATCCPALNGQDPVIPERFIAHIQNREKVGDKAIPKIALTGFFVKGQKGIVTALHGVVEYPGIWAGRHENEDKYIGYDNVKLIKVDIARDLALVSSPEIDLISGQIGFEEQLVLKESEKDADTRNAELLAGLKVIGFPKALFLHQRFDLTLARRRLTPLSDILSQLGGIYDELSARRSPLVADEVLSLSGFLQPGLSGAPVLNKDNRLVGVINGRIPSDPGEARGSGWAIPTPLRLADNTIWKDPKEVETELNRIRGRKLTFHTAIVTDPEDIGRFSRTVEAQKRFTEFAKKQDLAQALVAFQQFVTLQNTAAQVQMQAIQQQSNALAFEVIALKNRLSEIDRNNRDREGPPVSPVIEAYIPSPNADSFAIQRRCWFRRR
jgi:hypothetical protein